MSKTTNVPCVCVVVRRGSQALFVLREKTGYKDNQYTVPSGHVKDGETFRQAALRELKEETGLHAEVSGLEYIATVHRKEPNDIRIDVWFEAKKWRGEPTNAEPQKHAQVEWLDTEKLPKNTIDYISLGFKLIKSGESYAEFGFNG